jgi:2-polyprenyl-3-methyl-5-hydroxy-6-metoxy-1,4-benzoquinol methylase
VQTLDPIAKAYDAIGPYYKQWYWSKLWDTIEVPEVLAHIPPNIKVLDAGCASGRYAKPLLSRGCAYTGVDISSVQIQLAQTNTEGTFLCADIQEIPLANQTFDVILCTRVLNHGLCLKAVFSEFKRLIKPTGSIIITDFSDQYHYTRSTVPTPSGNVDIPVVRSTHDQLTCALDQADFLVQLVKLITDNHNQPLLTLTLATVKS